MTPPVSASNDVGTRPRVEGDREQEIFDVTLDVLAEFGYDRLTMDAVAARAHASKATLYRRFTGKAELVIESLLSQKEAPQVPDTGTLRGDLLATYCGMGGITDERQVAILASVMTAVARDQDFAAAFRRDFIGPKVAVTTTIFDRARERGEIADGVDLELIGPALPGICLHRQLLFGEATDVAFVTRVIDQIILPAAGVGQPTTTITKDQP